MATPVKQGMWAAADAAYAKGVEAYIDFGRALTKIDATQQEIADRYDMQQKSVAEVIAVGSDDRFIRITYKPKSTYTLYLLTTLDDKGFKALCKPTTTQEAILKYKAKLKPKKAAKPKKKGTTNTDTDGGDDTNHNPTPEDYYLGFCTRINTARECAEFGYPSGLPVDKSMVDSARAVAVLWEKLARKLETRL